MMENKKKRVLIATLGTAPSVVTEAIDSLLNRVENLDEIFLITTSDQDTDLALTILRYHISHYYTNQIKVHYYQIKSNYDILEKKSIWEFMKSMYDILKKYKDENYEIYASIAGGRKTMSALMTLAVQIFGTKELFHIITSDRDLITKGQINYIKSIIDDEEKLNEALHPPLEKIDIIQLPFIGFFPLISDMIKAFRNKPVQSEEIKQLIENDYFKNGHLVEHGEIFAGVLENIFDIIKKYYFDIEES